MHAAGVNALDLLVRQGGFEEFGHIAVPWIPGWDVSGVVEEVGSGASGYQVGDSVFGMVGMPEAGNAYAEYAAVPAEDVVAKPTKLDHLQSAAVPMAALTAWQAMFDEGRLQPGQRVLIHAAAGGVGHLATQLAAAHGARVVATASGANEEFVRCLGAAEFVDYRARAFEECVQPVDLVIDSLGGRVQERSLLAIKDGGVLVSLPGDVPGRCVARPPSAGLTPATLVCGRTQRRCLRSVT